MRKLKVLVSALLILGMTTSCADGNVSAKDNIVFEYGEEVPYVLEEYLELDTVDSEELANFKKEYGAMLKEQVDLILKDSRAKEGYLSVGEYVLTLPELNRDEKIEFEVKDTTAPQVKVLQEKVDTYVEVKPDYTKYFEVTELSGYEIIVDDSEVDYKKEGQYTVNAKVEDVYGNMTKKTLDVNVKKATLEVTNKDIKVTVGSMETIKSTVEGKSKDVTYTSNNAKIATVNKDGKVTAKKAGTTTITVKANGVEEKVKVTVIKGASQKVATPKATTPKTNKTSSTPKVKKNNTSKAAPKKESKKTTNTTPKSDSKKTTQAKPSGTYNLSLAKEAFAIQNRMRSEAGLPQLKWNGALYEKAKTRAYELTKSFSHTRPNGSAWHTVYGKSYRTLGENLGIRQSSASSVMNAWYKSPTHKANVLGSKFSSGAIVCYQENGKNHWAAVFAG